MAPWAGRLQAVAGGLLPRQLRVLVQAEQLQCPQLAQRRRNAAGQVVVVQAEDSKRPQMPDLSRNRACQVVPGDVC